MAAKQKTYEELDLSDDFMFGKIMRNPVCCKEMLERLLNIKIAKIKYPEDQKTIDISADSKSVRLDIYVEDEAETVYNVEIQTVNTGELPKRARYYSDMIDLNLIEKGITYKALNKSFVIFICTFDLSGRDFYQYTFENICREDTGLFLNDGVTKIFFNTKGKIGNISDEAKVFLRYIDGSQSDDDFVRRLDDEVKKARKNEEWRREYMTFLMRDQENLEEGRAEGRVEGEQATRVENAKTMLADGVDYKIVAKYSGLPLEEVEELAKLQPV